MSTVPRAERAHHYSAMAVLVWAGVSAVGAAFWLSVWGAFNWWANR